MVTHYFLVKCLQRLRLQGVEFEWDIFLDALESGDRWRVMASPMRKAAREQWIKKYGDAPPSLDYPSPWKIAEEFHSPEMKLDAPTSRKIWMSVQKGEDTEQVFAEYEYDHVVHACTMQNDGVFLIPADGEATVEAGILRGNVKLWLLKGLSEPDSLRELDDPSINRQRFKDILKAALKQTMDAEQRVKDLERTVTRLQSEIDELTDEYLKEVYRRKDLQQRIDDVRRLTEWSDRDEVQLTVPVERKPDEY